MNQTVENKKYKIGHYTEIKGILYRRDERTNKLIKVTKRKRTITKPYMTKKRKTEQKLKDFKKDFKWGMVIVCLWLIGSGLVAFAQTTNRFDISVPEVLSAPADVEEDYSGIPYIDQEGDKKEEVKELEPLGIVLGYDIRSYATDKQHETKIANLTKKIGEVDNALEIDAYIHSVVPASPITGKMVVNASNAYDVPCELILAIMQNDSSFGTAGIGARTNNPGNVGNNDSGATRKYSSWQAGVIAVSEWLNNHK